MPPKTRKRKADEISADNTYCKTGIRDVYDTLYHHFNNLKKKYIKGEKKLLNDVYKMNKEGYGDVFINTLMKKFADNGKEFRSKEDFLNTIESKITRMEKNYTPLETIAEDDEDEDEDEDDEDLIGLESILGKDSPIENFKHPTLDFKTIFQDKDGRKSKYVKSRSRKPSRKSKCRKSKCRKSKCRKSKSRKSSRKSKSRKII